MKGAGGDADLALVVGDGLAVLAQRFAATALGDQRRDEAAVQLLAEVVDGEGVAGGLLGAGGVAQRETATDHQRESTQLQLGEVRAAHRDPLFLEALEELALVEGHHAKQHIEGGGRHLVVEEHRGLVHAALELVHVETHGGREGDGAAAAVALYPELALDGLTHHRAHLAEGVAQAASRPLLVTVRPEGADEGAVGNRATAAASEVGEEEHRLLGGPAALVDTAARPLGGESPQERDAEVAGGEDRHGLGCLGHGHLGQSRQQALTTLGGGASREGLGQQGVQRFDEGGGGLAFHVGSSRSSSASVRRR